MTQRLPPHHLQAFFPETPSVWEPHLQVAAQMKIICGGHIEVGNKGCSRLEMPSPGGSGSPAATCCPRAGGGSLHTPGATSGSWEQGGGMCASLVSTTPPPRNPVALSIELYASCPTKSCLRQLLSWLFIKTFFPLSIL